VMPGVRQLRYGDVMKPERLINHLRICLRL
jgi:hypothetical protein